MLAAVHVADALVDHAQVGGVVQVQTAEVWQSRAPSPWSRCHQNGRTRIELSLLVWKIPN